MPDSNNRFVKQDLQEALGAAELRIVQYQPPAATINQNGTPNSTGRVNISDIQRQAAQKASQERTDALFGFLLSFITQGASDEIGKQQIIQRIGNLERRISALESGLSRSGSI